MTRSRPRWRERTVMTAMYEETAKAQDAPVIDEFMELFKLLTGPQRKMITFIAALNAACNEEGYSCGE